MKMSTKGQYSLRAMVALAERQRQTAGEWLSISQMAELTGVTDRYLEKLLRQLKAAGLIETSRGVAGGYRLARPASQMAVGEILRVSEGGLEPVDCVQLGGSVCARQEGCVLQYVWKRISDSINEAVDGITLAELIGMKPSAASQTIETNKTTKI